jgi:hypothetical protein
MYYFAPFIENVLIPWVNTSFGHFVRDTRVKVFPVNAKGCSEILGVIICRSLDDINEQIDVAVL